MDEQEVCIHSDCTYEQIFGIDICHGHFIQNGHYQSRRAKKFLRNIIWYFEFLTDKERSRFPKRSIGQGGIMHNLFFGRIDLKTAEEQVNSIAVATGIPTLDIKIGPFIDIEKEPKWWEEVSDSTMCSLCQEESVGNCHDLDGPMLCADCIKNWRMPKSRKPRYNLIQKISDQCVIDGCNSQDLVDSNLTLTGLNGAPFPAGRLCKNCVDIEVREISQGRSSFGNCYECGTHSTSGPYRIKEHWDTILTYECDGCNWVYPK